MLTEEHHQHIHGGWRVSDRVFVWLSWGVVLLTLLMLCIAYPALPTRIPSHFNAFGAVDASTQKSWWSVFFPVILQGVLSVLLYWLSRHPEYSNLPTSLPLRAVPEPAQSFIRRLLAHLLVMTNLITNLILAYIALAVVRVGLGETERLNAWVVFGLVGLLIALLSVYSIWIARVGGGKSSG